MSAGMGSVMLSVAEHSELRLRWGGLVVVPALTQNVEESEYRCCHGEDKQGCLDAKVQCSDR